MIKQQSGDRIRERFLSKIGIESPQQQPISNKTDRNSYHINGGSIQPQSFPCSCLGEVKPTYEPLKVCLDDDSSMEDGEFDDDFFFGDDDDFEAMAVEFFGRCDKQDAVGKGGTDAIVPPPSLSNQIEKTATTTAMQCSQSVPIVSDNETSSRVTSFSSSSISPSMVSATSSSGTLSRCSQSEGSLESNSKSKRGQRSKRRVSLHNDVLVLPIPMRSEYSDRIRERLWSSPTELYHNAARNMVEFAAEGWNWRGVTEDENMIVHKESGELIHPIHLQHALQRSHETGAPSASHTGVAKARANSQVSQPVVQTSPSSKLM